MKLTFVKSSLGVGALLAALGTGNADAASLCLPGTNAHGLSVSDVTFGGLNATNCYGVVDGNTSNQGLNDIGDGAIKFGGGNWGAELKDDNPGSPVNGTLNFHGVEWTLSASSAGESGSWTLSFVDANPSVLNFTADVLVVLKGGPYFATYFFDDFLFTTTGESGEYQMYSMLTGGGGGGESKGKGKGKGESTPVLTTFGLSHLSVYFRDATPVCVNGECEPTEELPEPVTMLLLGTGLVGLGVARRRFRA